MSLQKALFHFQLGEFEEAITIFDDEILPNCKKEPGPSPLSDAASLLMRLHREGMHALFERSFLRFCVAIG